MYFPVCTFATVAAILRIADIRGNCTYFLISHKVM